METLALISKARPPGIKMTSMSDGNNVLREIRIKKLKDFALKLPSTHPLRSVLLVEDDKIDVVTFLARLPIWLRLARLEGKES